MRTENTIHIAAPPHTVWTVTLDIDRWPEWTPTVTEVARVDEGSFGPGSVVRIKQPLQPMAEWVVTEFEPGKSFAWETQRFGLRMAGGHELHPDDAGTRSVLSVEATGPLAVALWPLLRFTIRRTLPEENRGLKSRCEAIAKTDPDAD